MLNKEFALKTYTKTHTHTSDEWSKDDVNNRVYLLVQLNCPLKGCVDNFRPRRAFSEVFDSQWAEKVWDYLNSQPIGASPNFGNVTEVTSPFLFHTT